MALYRCGHSRWGREGDRPLFAPKIGTKQVFSPIEVNRSRPNDPLRNVHAIAARLITATTQDAAVLEDVLSAPAMRKDVIRLSRRRRQRVHIIEQNIARRTVRNASRAAGREDSLTPMPILTRPGTGGHQERHPLATNSNGPPLTRKATLEIYTVAPVLRPPPPQCFRTPPGVVSDLPRVQDTPRGVTSTPGGGSETPPGTGHPRGAREALPGGDPLSGGERYDVRDAVRAVPDLS